MKLCERPIKSLCIVGGGTAGWMAATMLSNIFNNTGVRITLVESPDIATIGVGEATIPPFLVFLKSAGMDIREFMRATAGTFKLGIRFDNWYASQHSYFHPFGQIGRNIDGHEFYQVWLKNQAQGDVSTLMEHSPAAVMANAHRFMLESELVNTPLASSSHALHLDAVLAARYMRQHAEKNGVVRLESTVTSVSLDDAGYIERINLANSQQIESDFFIDCTGFKSLLIGDALQVGYENWSHYLPCNRAVAVQTENTGEPAPYTIATARDAGWTWKIPLQHRTGNGYVFCDKYCSDNEAIQTLLNHIDGKLLNEPRVIPFVTGKRNKIWHKNCLALGLASGFLEPLESTAIHLVFKTLAYFIRHFPDRDFDPVQEQLFNSKINKEYNEIRDFLVLHYCTTTREDTPFWRWCKTMEIPETLAEKLDLFRRRGQLLKGEEDLFRDTSWYAVLEGMHQRPHKYHPLVDALDGKKLAQSLSQGKSAIHELVRRLPSHQQFIEQYCPVNIPI